MRYDEVEADMTNDFSGSHATLLDEPVRSLVSLDLPMSVVHIDSSWMDRAACKGRLELFFGIAGERPERRVRREAAALKVCEACPVMEPCRQAARLNRESGFWGGESEEERAMAGYAPRSVSRRSVQAAASQGSSVRQAEAS
jgi:WhiB family transcriptional regulator, redox-sensing transcriptional regulator